MCGVLSLLAALAVMLVGCNVREGCTDPRALNYDEDAKRDGPCVYPSQIEITQTQLDAVISPIPAAQNLRGNPFAVPGHSSHSGPVTLVPSPDSTERSVYSSHPATLPVPLATIVSKRIWRVQPNGTRGARLSTFIMVKQNPGYYPEGGDYEYILIPAGSINHTVNPNGVLTSAARRGKLSDCAACHALGGPDFLFER